MPLPLASHVELPVVVAFWQSELLLLCCSVQFETRGLKVLVVDPAVILVHGIDAAHLHCGYTSWASIKLICLGLQLVFLHLIQHTKQQLLKHSYDNRI